MTATTAAVVASVRQKMRDFSRMFQTSIVGDGTSQIFELPVVMVETTDLSVTITNVNQATPQNTTLALNTGYTLDAHHGMLMLAAGRILLASEVLTIFGTHYEWFLDSDITAETEWFVDSLNTSMDNDRWFVELDTTDARFELVVRGVLVGCLWSLLIEASLDIDVRNPEGVDIPTSQRFAHLTNLVGVWTARYTDLATTLNIGISRIEMTTMRRVSYSTGRLVPIYAGQEFDDRATPFRMRPLIDSDQGLSDPGDLRND